MLTWNFLFFSPTLTQHNFTVFQRNVLMLAGMTNSLLVSYSTFDRANHSSDPPPVRLLSPRHHYLLTCVMRVVRMTCWPTSDCADPRPWCHWDTALAAQADCTSHVSFIEDCEFSPTLSSPQVPPFTNPSITFPPHPTPHPYLTPVRRILSLISGISFLLARKG